MPVRWDDSQGNAYILRDTGVNVPALTRVGTSAVYLPKFAVNDFLVFNIQLPHGWKEGSAIRPHVHWFGSTTEANTVKWELEYEWVNVTGVWTAAPGTVLTVEEAPTAYKHEKSGFGEVVGTGKTISSMLAGRIRRITNGAVEYGGDVFLSWFDCHLRLDARGSSQVFTK